MRKTILYSAIASALGLTSMTVAADAKPEVKADKDLERIVITGTTKRGLTELQSSVAMTIVDSSDLDREQPMGVGDALDVVPGLFVENSSGEIGINVSPRGLQAGDQQRYTAYQEDGLSVNYTGEWTDQMMRTDIMTQRLDVVRGGTSGILAVNGPGALVNFVTRRGGDTAEGQVRLTVSDYGMVRNDFFLGGPISENWKLAVGGFYRTSEGQKDAGFEGNRGGQVRMNLTRDFDKGTFNLSYKKINDNVIFYLPVPMQNQSNPSAIPGFDPLTDTLLSADAKNITYKRPNGDLQLDLSDGADNVVDAVGFEADFDLTSEWSFLAKTRLTKTAITFNGNFPGGNGGLVLASDRIDPNKNTDIQNLIDTFGGTPELRFTSSGGAVTNIANLNSNGLVSNSWWGYAERNIEEVASDIRFTYESGNNSLSFGALLFSTDYEFLESGALFLQEVKGQPRRLDIVTVGNSGEVLGSLTDNSFLDYGGWYGHGFIESTSQSFYINDTYQYSDELMFDFGYRVETLDLNLNVESTNYGADLNPNSDVNESNNVLADDTIGASGSGFYAPHSGDITESAWTTGFNYLLSDELALYGRYAKSFDMPRTHNAIWGLSGNPGATQQQVDDAIGKTTDLDLIEFGARWEGEDLSFSATLFQTVFNDLTITVNESGNPFSTTVDTETNGVEFDLLWTPTEAFTIEFSGVAQDPKLKGIPASADESGWNGNQIQRTPKLNMRLTPSYEFSLADSMEGDVFAIIQHTGSRFADLPNQVELPAYTVVDLGVRFNLGDNMTLQLKGNNIFDEFALTEGSPRSGLDQTAERYYFARPKFGRNFTASITYSF